MRYRSFIVAVCFAAAVVRADDTSATLVRADEAFAAADYRTAVALYQKLGPQLTDAGQKSAMEERMRFATRQLSQPADSTPTVAPAAPPATQPAARQPHAPPVAGQTLELTLHELGNFDFNPDDAKGDFKAMIPADVWKLDGTPVKITGCMLALDQAGRVTRFMLVNDMMSCCFGQAPKIQHVALVTLPKDKWMANTRDRITIEGKLKVNIRKDDDFVSSIFEIEPTSIKLAAP